MLTTKITFQKFFEDYFTVDINEDRTKKFIDYFEVELYKRTSEGEEILL